MATSFKTFLNNDITSTKTLLHEAIPITGSIVSGTYGTFPNGGNIKNYAHGMFQSVYDYPYLSSSANHIFDLTVGYSTGSDSVSASTNTQNAKKVNLYNQMAQVLQGHNQNGKILRFDQDGNLVESGAGSGTKLDNVVFINFARLLQKDEIKKGSFTIKFGAGAPWADPFSGLTEILTIQDTNAENDYRVNSPAGEYGILSASAGYNSDFTTAPACGLIFYQAGVAVLSGSIFMSGSAANPLGGVLSSSISMSADSTSTTAYTDFAGMLTGSGISASCNEIRHRLYDLSFNNTTELNSTIHFCRINHNDFNYSANPTYLSSSKIVVKNNSLDAPVSYLTTVGLYSSDNELLAVAKLSEPLKKDPTNEMTLRVRLDY